MDQRLENLSFSIKIPGRIDVRKVSCEKIMIIEGEAGTGKTTLLKPIIKALKDNKRSFSICAFSGKAADRLREVLKENALTIDKVFGKNFGTKYELDPSFPLKDDFLIVDEISMLPLDRFCHFVNSVGKNTRLILLGDSKQIQSRIY